MRDYKTPKGGGGNTAKLYVKKIRSEHSMECGDYINRNCNSEALDTISYNDPIWLKNVTTI